MPKKGVNSNSPARKKAKHTKKTQISVAGGSSGFIQRITISKEGRLLEKDILLGEEIYVALMFRKKWRVKCFTM